MPSEQCIDNLLQEIDLMTKCYLKGFGHFVTEIRDECYSYLDDDLKPTEYARIKDVVQKHLETIENYYKHMPFDDMDSNSDFAPLFVIKAMLPGYGELVRDFLEKPSDVDLKDIDHRTTTIVDVGQVYKDNFNSRLDELRQIPGYSDFRVKFIDHKGDTFYK